jgi:hypothetical protein
LEGALKNHFKFYKVKLYRKPLAAFYCGIILNRDTSPLSKTLPVFKKMFLKKMTNRRLSDRDLDFAEYYLTTKRQCLFA